MGKVIISTHTTIDGVIGPSPGDWAILEGEGERYKYDQLLAAEAFLLGRKVYEGLAGVWPTITDDTGFAERVNSMPKYVASRTLHEPLERNASLIKGDLAESVADLKRQHRGNLLSFGCGELAYELATQGLADEIHFWVNPAVWGGWRTRLPWASGQDAADRHDRLRLRRHPALLSASGSRAGAPGGTRTPNLLIRSQMLYPIELQAPEVETECTKEPVVFSRRPRPDAHGRSPSAPRCSPHL
jgi:dihydrofolate reductase